MIKLRTWRGCWLNPLGKPQKRSSSSLNGHIKGGGGKGQGQYALRKKITFLDLFFQRSNVPTASKAQGGLNGQAIKRKKRKCGFP